MSVSTDTRGLSLAEIAARIRIVGAGVEALREFIDLLEPGDFSALPHLREAGLDLQVLEKRRSQLEVDLQARREQLRKERGEEPV